MRDAIGVRVNQHGSAYASNEANWAYQVAESKAWKSAFDGDSAFLVFWVWRLNLIAAQGVAKLERRLSGK